MSNITTLTVNEIHFINAFVNIFVSTLFKCIFDIMSQVIFIVDVL